MYVTFDEQFHINGYVGCHDDNSEKKQSLRFKNGFIHMKKET